MKTSKKTKVSKKGDKEYLPGYPDYPESEDIYNSEMEDKEINPENTEKLKKKTKHYRKSNEKDFDDVETGSDLDIPGMDENEDDFSFEDEENDYYSLGGDDHEDLEDDWGD